MVRFPVRPPVATVAVALPPLLLAVAAAALLLLAVVGMHPLWRSHELSLPGAALSGNDAAVARMVMQGADINARGPVRGAGRDEGELMTPLEGAIVSREAHTLETVFRFGASLQGEAAQSATCLALAKADHLLPLLQQRGAPPVDPAICASRQR